ncbi:histidine phosphatase family protein [Mycolicibacterium brumae]|uniref:Histidine phosphatase family protein n=1 Tax=Mycolicibacterium brumae TaxID=85968 RepID=A0A2G5P6V5_9MYCO|nr:histidine phosphatase family protein [Mycolicibacterium brumae]MCV7193796.1 histidine phosphatase family protein [Mycolicibacterium brumae]PIB73996.1 histidine phosphatase family protein [Mycolicibacterium brumae]UWW07347.1 histidine phosphatase family protein [Mycolicibacterium brumae]
MSQQARLTLVSHGFTDAMSAGLFGVDEPLNSLGVRQITELGSSRPDLALRADLALRGPELRCRQSAELAGLAAQTEPALADLDPGTWRGRALDDLAPADLAAWLTDPDAAPHGGESLTELIARVGGWLETLGPGRTVAVTHPAVIRAAVVNALGAPATAFWRIDVRPAGVTQLHRRPAGWTLRL